MALLVSCGPLEPGTYTSPLVRLQRLQGQVSHLHTDEVRYRSDGKLFQCAYTFGVVDATNPASMRYLAENLKHTIPSDTRKPGCIHLAWDGNIVYTTHRGNIDNPAFLTAWDLRPSPTNPNSLSPVQLPVLQEPGVSYEGVDVANSNIYVGLHEKGLGVYRRDTTTSNFTRIGTATGFVNAWGVQARDNTVFVADGLGGLVIVDVTDPTQPKIAGQVETGGFARGVVVEGNIAYVAAGSAGLVVVDVSDLANPTVIGKAEMPGTALRVAYAAGHVYVAAWNDTRAYDVSEPAKPRFIGAVRLTEQIAYPEDGRPPITTRTLGVAANNDTVFIGNWYILYSYRVRPERTAPNLLLPEDINLVDFGPVEAGKSKTLPLEVRNQGTAPLTLFNNWTEGTSFTVSPRQVRIPPGGKTTLSLTYRATTMDREVGFLHINSDDPDAPTRTGFLVGNQPGLGVGKPLPEITATLMDGSEWSSSQVQGQPMLLAYFATF